MLTEKDYCDKDLSLALKEAGYIGQGRCYYDLDKEPNKLRHFGIQVLTTRSAEALNFVLAVHLYDAQKWLREEKNIIVEVFVDDDSDTPITYNIYEDGECVCHHHGKYWSVKGWSEALSEGIKAAVKILKGEDND
jgi:hypothetical protein